MCCGVASVFLGERKGGEREIFPTRPCRREAACLVCAVRTERSGDPQPSRQGVAPSHAPWCGGGAGHRRHSRISWTAARSARAKFPAFIAAMANATGKRPPRVDRMQTSEPFAATSRKVAGNVGIPACTDTKTLRGPSQRPETPGKGRYAVAFLSTPRHSG